MTRTKTFSISALAAVLALSAFLAGCGDGKSAVTKGEEALAKGEFKTAAKYFKRAAAKNPNCMPLFYNLGAACALAGDTQGAISAFNEVLRFAPGDPDASEYLAAELAKTGRPEDVAKAHELLSELLSFDNTPEVKARLYTSLSRCDIALHREDLALGHLLQARMTAPAYAPALFNLAKLQGDVLKLYTQAAATMESFTALSGANPGKVTKAREYCEGIRTLAANAANAPHTDKDDALALINKGAAEYAKNNYKIAEEFFGKALQADPHSYNAALYRAHALLAMNRTDEAAGLYAMAADLNPDAYDPAFMMVRCAYSAGNCEAAIRNLTQVVIPKWPGKPEAYEILSYAYGQTHRYYEARLFGELHVLASKASGKSADAFAKKWLSQLPVVKFAP